MKSITETSILSVLFGGIAEERFRGKRSSSHRVFAFAMQPRAVGFEESIDRSKILYACVSGSVRDEFRMKRQVSFQKMSRTPVFLAFVYT
jgi:hypothetical protein